jgi:hypothetical protein
LLLSKHNIIIVLKLNILIPKFNTEGNLPPGIHWTTWDEFFDRFGINDQRIYLIKGLKRAISNLRVAGCSKIFIDGSFTTDKETPSDYDACWDVNGVNPNILNQALLDFSPSRKYIQYQLFHGDIFPANYDESTKNISFLDYFQTDKSGNSKGIIALNL